jgi:two-component system sensor histidine kinase KdpD
MTLDEPRRPDPDALLEEARRAGRGRLKVFLGMSPGVGKTYEMLHQGRRKAPGVEASRSAWSRPTGGRDPGPAEGPEVLPGARSTTNATPGVRHHTALARSQGCCSSMSTPTQRAGLRHPKRWQDVQELLEAGIDVWTTLNVQHLESLVTWSEDHRRAPARDGAGLALSDVDEIEVVDITPAELRQRLRRRSLPDTARQAAVHFFKPENDALRELALRRAAQTIDYRWLSDAPRRRGGAVGRRRADRCWWDPIRGPPPRARGAPPR